MTNNTLKVIGKYAILLVVFYVLEVLVGYTYKYFIEKSNSYLLKGIVMGSPTYFKYLLNILIAIVLNADRKKLKIEGKYSVLLTIVYRPIGIVLFLIYLINKEIKEKTTTNF